MSNPKEDAGNTDGMLKSILTIASAELISVLIRIGKAKFIAMTLGPTGTGLLSVYANLQSMTSMTASLGLPQSGVRELASPDNSQADTATVRSALVAGLILQGIVATAVLWILKEEISRWLFGNEIYSTSILLIGISVILHMTASAQQTILRGLRRIADLGRTMVVGTLVGTIGAIAVIWAFGEEGLAWILVAEAASLLVVGTIYVRRLRIANNNRQNATQIWSLWKSMARIGFAFMIGSLITTLTLLMVRSVIVKELGLNEAGLFAAAWAISTIYFGFLLQSMGTDLFPRLVEVATDKEKANQLVNDQIQIGLALGSPVILVAIGCAPWALSLLYTSEFEDAVRMVQWLALGDMIKIAGFPYGFYLIAVKESKLYIILQLIFNGLFLGLSWLMLPVIGALAAVLACTTAYLLSTILTISIIHFRSGLTWSGETKKQLALHFTMTTVIFAAAGAAPLVAPAMSLLFALAATVISSKLLISKLSDSSRLKNIITRIYEKIEIAMMRIK